MFGWFLLALLALGLVSLAVFVMNIRSGLVAMKKSIGRNRENLDGVLQQRGELLPELLNACAGPLPADSAPLEAVVAARAQLDQARGDLDRAQAQNRLSQALGALLAAAAESAEFQADPACRQIAGRLAELEEKLGDRREFLNEVVNSYNVRLEQSPDWLVARLGNFPPAALWPVDPPRP